jgi:hypothetical protein
MVGYKAREVGRDQSIHDHKKDMGFILRAMEIIRNDKT